VNFFPLGNPKNLEKGCSVTKKLIPFFIFIFVLWANQREPSPKKNTLNFGAPS
jgi:hypothetical protein